MLLPICILLLACGELPTDGARVRELTVQEKDVAKANTAFGLALLADMHATESSGNLLLSPLSVSMALGMTLNGANSATYDAMRRTLAFDAASQQEINAAYSGLIQQLKARDHAVEFGLANSLWYDTGFPVYNTFVDTVRHYFDAEVRQLDFGASGSPRVISQWAEQKTSGRIKDLIKQINSDEVMFLVNAVYFKAPWTTVFNENATHDAPFRRPDGSTVTARMMTNDAAYGYVKQDGVQAVELLYGDSAFSMVLVSAEQGTSLAPAAAMLERTKWESLMGALQRGRVMLSMPRFKFTYEKSLDDVLSALGMSIAFDRQRADFTRIADVRPRNLFISRVQHKTFIDVHEKGTEAAGATVVGVGVTSLPPSLTFDRPFLFVIRERTTGTLLFVGRVVDPTK